MLQPNGLYNPQKVIFYLHDEVGLTYNSIALAIGRSRSSILAIANGTRNGQKCQRDLSILYELSKKKVTTYA